jgi:uncharacterized membrane protein YphA (DoxX/SURF4 family)
MQNFTRIGTLGLIAIVALRIGIGWHFFKEGSDKIKSGNFSSEGFLKNAQGRMSGFYQGMVWDHDGKLRLDRDLMKSQFEAAETAAVKHFGLTDTQQASLKEETTALLQRYEAVFDTHKEPILKYQKGEERISKMDSSPVWNDISSLRGQKEKIAKERLAGVQPALESINVIWEQFGETLNKAASPEQLASGKFELRRPQEGLINSKVVDRIIPIFDITVGVLLIVGLFVPFAGLAAAAFLVSVILSQFPGDPNTQPTYLYAVEALALIALASIGAGRFAGLDFLFWAWRKSTGAQPTPQTTASSPQAPASSVKSKTGIAVDETVKITAAEKTAKV